MRTLRISLSNAALLTSLGLGLYACETPAPYQTAYNDWPGYQGRLRDSDDDRDRSRKDRKDKAHSDKGHSGKAHGGHRSGGRSGGKSGGDRPK